MCVLRFTGRVGLSLVFFLVLMSFNGKNEDSTGFVVAFAPLSNAPTTTFTTPSWKDKNSSGQRLQTISTVISTSHTVVPAGSTSTRMNAYVPHSHHAILDLPRYFFVFTFPMLGILLDISRNFARLRMEERAWEQRLEEARMRRLKEDPTLTELDIRRREAALEWSAYGKPRKQEVELERALREEENRFREGGRRRGVTVMDRDFDDEDEDEEEIRYSENRMTDEEINLFEMEYGVEYDPYYDDPYTEDELPNDIPYKVDKKYGDRIYNNGEIFYKDRESGLFYRQGAKPRNLSFW